MNRIARVSVVFAAVLMFSVGAVFAQGGQRGMVERKAWYVDTDKKIHEVLYWRIYLGDYDVNLKRTFPGEGQITLNAGMNFQFFSAGYIEGNGHSAKGKVSSLPGMRIKAGNSEAVEIKIGEIDYIYDYGTKVAAKDGRKGDFLIGGEGGDIMEIKRFQITEYKMFKGSFGEMELKETTDRQPAIGISFTKEGAARAAAERTSD
ncbi:MAG: hypothetical protein LBH93_08940 [Chitinispirillales bacterium]|jgi:hypothetical protein|nr:hypothetical protein [Chitinispirillales bacterium]